MTAIYRDAVAHVGTNPLKSSYLIFLAEMIMPERAQGTEELFNIQNLLSQSLPGQPGVIVHMFSGLSDL